MGASPPCPPRIEICRRGPYQGTVASSTILAGGRVWGIVPRAMIPFGERPGDSTTETKSSGPAFEDAAFAAKALKSGVPDQLARPTWVDAQGRPVTNGNSKQEGEGEGEQKSFATAVESMHERKLVMSRLAERGFFALPGGARVLRFHSKARLSRRAGYGTFEELMEMVTWTQLGIRPLFSSSPSSTSTDVLPHYRPQTGRRTQRPRALHPASTTRRQRRPSRLHPTRQRGLSRLRRPAASFGLRGRDRRMGLGRKGDPGVGRVVCGQRRDGRREVVQLGLERFLDHRRCCSTWQG